MVCVITDQTEVERHDRGEHGEKNSENEQKILRIKWTGEDEAVASIEGNYHSEFERKKHPQKTSAGPITVSFPNV